jgi:hypothetical protein
MAIYQQAHLKQSIPFTQDLFLDDERQNSIGAVEPDFFLHVAWKITNWQSDCGIEIVDRPRIAEERKKILPSQENGNNFMIEHSKEQKGFR